MAQSALRLSTTPRTITVRVRTLIILAAVAAVIGGVWWALSWATGLQPLGPANAAAGRIGLPVVARTPDALGSGPTAYGWRPGGIYEVTLGFHNTASVPITITGADHTFPGDRGAIAGPTLANATADFALIHGAFHAVRIPANGTRVVGFLFRANPRYRCSEGAVFTMDSVTVRFTVLGVFHETQSVPLGDMAAVMTARRGGC